MASSSAFSAIQELSLEERLLTALITGPLEQSEELLDALEEVDVRMLNHRTLLHVGVSLGKVDWVEELLARGANPELVDGSHLTAISSAEEMLRKFPEDSDRGQVRRMIRMVHRRDQAMRRRLQTPSAKSAAFSTPPVLQSDHTSAMAALSSSMDALKVELRSSLEELKGQVCGRDALLRSLEAAVTSSAEQLTSLNGRLQEETILGAMGTTSETPLPPSSMADERRECVEGMMRKTEVVFGGEKGVRFVRRLYGRIFDEDVVTECLVQFLRRESRFVAKVDCGSNRIERMMETVVDLDGRERSGSNFLSFAEFSTNTVYLGAKVDYYLREGEVAGSLAYGLAQMSFHIAFKNGGKAYEGGDNVREKEFKRALEEAKEEKRKRGDGLDWWIRDALDRNTQTLRESCLAACVPGIIARYGSNEGTSMLQEQVPLLLHYFKEHVVSTLLAKARESQQLQQRSDGP